MNKTLEVEENGKIVTYEIIILCRYKDNTYIIYKETNGNEYYASKYYVTDNKIILDEINTDEEWDYLNKKLGDKYD